MFGLFWAYYNKQKCHCWVYYIYKHGNCCWRLKLSKTAYSNARKSLASGAYQIQNKAKKVKYEELLAHSVSAFANDLIFFIFCIPRFDDKVFVLTKRCKKILNCIQAYLLGAKNMKSVQFCDLCSSVILPLYQNWWELCQQLIGNLLRRLFWQKHQQN